MITIDFKESKEFVQFNTPQEGSFGLDNGDVVNWVKCREQFSDAFTEEIPGIFFNHVSNSAVNIAQFIRRTEQIINADNKLEYSEFATTCKPGVLWIKPSDFWRCCPMRRQLFTILLRASVNFFPLYTDDVSFNETYEKTLYSYSYILTTKQAVMRFLFGFNKFINCDNAKIGLKYGWVNAFEHKPVDDIRAKLVRSEGTNEENCLIGLGTIWS